MPETPLHLELSTTTDRLILTPVTRVLGPDGVGTLIQAIDQAIATAAVACRIQVVLDGVDLMTSGAIGALIVLHKRLRTTDHRLELINPSPAVREAMEFLKLDLVFTISHAV
jgi:anti-anti-sigma factor